MSAPGVAAAMAQGHASVRVASASLAASGSAGGSAAADSSATSPVKRPDALEHFHSHIAPAAAGKRLVVFLDYDGTLTPIVARPEQAVMSDGMRGTLQRLAGQYVTAIVTGRSVRKVVDFIRLDELYYAGSHGFQIRGPSGSKVAHSVADDMRPRMKDTLDELKERVAHVEGAELEDNYMTVSVHYRAVEAGKVKDVEEVIDTYLSESDSAEGLVKRHGKKVFELRPKVDWHKGHAVRWLAKYLTKTLGCSQADLACVYVGDDVSDEDAFAALADMPCSVSVLVSESARETQAKYQLPNPAAVQRFLQALTSMAPRGADGDAASADMGARSDAGGGAGATTVPHTDAAVAGAGAGAGAGACQDANGQAHVVQPGGDAAAHGSTATP